VDDHGKVCVRDFLVDVKQTITAPGDWSGWVLVPREENMRCISKLGFKLGDVRDEILSLSVEDYCDGPVMDRDEPGQLWVFGKAIKGMEVYIKLKLATFGTTNPIKQVRVISFHAADKRLPYPYKEEG
jgi:hypothetical protein